MGRCENTAVDSATVTPQDAEAAWLARYGQARRHGGPGTRLQRARRPVLVLAVLAGVLAVSARALEHHAWRPPSGLGGFHACTYGGRIAAWCAQVPVPADPSRPQGAQLGLRVTVIPATKRPAQGALFYLEGGPGGAASDAALSVMDTFGPIGVHRDLVLLDQRGTGGSQALSCPPGAVGARDVHGIASYVRHCFAALGSRARLDSSAVAADDVDAVRRALGYGRIDLFGGSYGATLAQVVLARHPRAVRSAILDGVSLLGVPLYERSPASAQRAVRLQLARCAADSACHRAFPHAAAELATLLRRPPQRVRLPAGDVVRISSDDVADTVAELMRAPAGAAELPLLVHEAVRGDYEPLAAEFETHVGPRLERRLRLAMAWTISCSEPWARFGVAATRRAGRGSFLAHAAAGRARAFTAACAAVPLGVQASATARPPHTAVPVLLLAGQADPLDPAGNLRGWRASFPNGRLVVATGVGHGAMQYGCVPLLAARFVAAGSARGLDIRCAAHVPLPAFATAGLQAHG